LFLNSKKADETFRILAWNPRINAKQLIIETFHVETGPSDLGFYAYKRESVKTWFRSDYDSVAKRSGDSKIRYMKRLFRESGSQTFVRESRSLLDKRGGNLKNVAGKSVRRINNNRRSNIIARRGQ
jgi:hypothetical protein